MLQGFAIRFRVFFLLTCCLGFLLVAAVGFAQQELPIGVAEFPPFKFERDGKIVGSDTEIVAEVAKRMGYLPKIYMQPWKRVQKNGEDGKFALIYTFTKSPEREQFYYFTDPLNTVKDVFYKLKDRDLTWETLDDLKAYKIGASSGYNYAPVFMEAMQTETINVHLITGDAPELQLLQMLILGRVDLCICEVSVCQHFIRENAPKFDQIDFIDTPIGEVRTFHAGFSKKWPGAEQLVQEFNAELAKFVAEGKRKQIFEKYGIISSLE